ncbi:MAG: histidinol-phosphatase [Clostridia bacterium]|nr:histidinol-phosphatase [Clostridia bacterium]
MKCSYHNHTTRCNHATGTEAEYLGVALRAGYRVFGFSDHAPQPFSDGFISPSRMRMEQLPEYVSTIRELREPVKDRISVPIGLEMEYYPAIFKDAVDYYLECGVEYLILGQHGLREEGKPDWVNSFFKQTDKAVLTEYVDTCIEAMETGVYSYFAHPDVLKFEGDEKFYEKEVRRLLAATEKYRMPVEVNMFGILDGRHYPNPAFWRIASEYRLNVLLGRDAHAVSRVDPTSEYPNAYAFVKKCGLKLTDTVDLKKPFPKK